MNIIDVVSKALEKQCNVLFAYLYGSYARGEAHKFSDLDVAVYLKEFTIKNYLDLFSVIPTSVNVEIDLRALNNAPPLFRYRVIKEGRLLFVKDKKALEKFVYETLIEALEIKETISSIERERIKRFLNDKRNR